MDADKSGDEEPKESGEGHKLIIPKHIEEEGAEAIKKYLDDLFSKALLGMDSTQTEQNPEAHQHSNSIQLDSKTHITQEGKSLFLKSFVKLIKLMFLYKNLFLRISRKEKKK